MDFCRLVSLSFLMMVVSSCGKIGEIELGKVSSNLPSMAISIAPITLSEGSSAIVAFAISGTNPSGLTIRWEIVGAGAIADFVTTTGTTSVPANSLTGTSSIVSLDNIIHQSDRIYDLKLWIEGFESEGSTTSLTILDNDTAPTVSWNSSVSSALENSGTITFTAELSARSGVDITVPFTLSGSSTLGSDYTISSSPLTISAGSTSATLTISLVNDPNVETDETVVITMGTPLNASAGPVTVHTATIENEDVGAFSISGIQSATLDTTTDAYLNFESAPKILFGTSAEATSYDVTILNSDDSIRCVLQNTTSTTFSPGACVLVPGMNYKAVVAARNGTTSLAALNSPFSFSYNRAPSLSSDLITLNYNGAAVIFDPRANDTDPDGDPLTITGVGASAYGATSFNGTSVTFTPDGANYGTTSFSYTVSDGRGSTTTGVVNARVMTGFTWTGLSSTVPRVWSDPANWCGSVTTPGPSGVCSGTLSFPSDETLSSHTAVFNSTCTNCSVSISSAVKAYKIDMQTGYNGTITQVSGVGNTITVGAGGWSLAAGTFVGGNAEITLSGVNTTDFYYQTAGSFTNTSSSLILDSSGASGLNIFRKTGGSFAGGTVIFRGDSTGNKTYNIFGYQGASHVKFQSTGGASAAEVTTFTFSQSGYQGNIASYESGRFSGSGSVLVGLHTGEPMYGLNSGTAIANAGSLGGAFVIRPGSASTSIGSYGGGFLPKLSFAAASTMITPDINATQVALDVFVTAPIGTFTIRPISGPGLYSVRLNGNNSGLIGGTIKVLSDVMTQGSVTIYRYLSSGVPDPIMFNNFIFESSVNGTGPIGLTVPDVVTGNLIIKQTGTAPILQSGSSSPNTVSVHGDVTFDGVVPWHDVPAYRRTLILNGPGSQTIHSINNGKNPINYLVLDMAAGESVELNGNLDMSVVNPFGTGQSVIFNNDSVMNMNGYNFRIGNGSGVDSTLTLNGASVINRGGGILSYEGALIGTGTINP